MSLSYLLVHAGYLDEFPAAYLRPAFIGAELQGSGLWRFCLISIKVQNMINPWNTSSYRCLHEGFPSNIKLFYMDDTFYWGALFKPNGKMKCQALMPGCPLTVRGTNLGW